MRLSIIIIISIIFYSFSSLSINAACIQEISCESRQSLLPESAVRSFYKWYLEVLKQQINPLKECRPELSRFVTSALMEKLIKEMEGPEGIRVDYFLNAQDYDDDWGNQVNATTKIKEGGQVVLDVILSGKQIPNHRLEISLIREGRDWKIDSVERAR